MEKNMTGHNGLNDDQERALAYHHKGHYSRALAIFKKAQADLRNAAKRAKAEGVSLDDIKLLIEAEEDGGDVKLRGRLAQQIKVVRWALPEVGGQFTFLDEPDRTPLEERAFEEGKIAGMDGKNGKAPDGYSGRVEQEWLRGHVAGQDALKAALDLTKKGMAAKEADRAEGPKKRGRPPGAKNKSKDKTPPEPAKPFSQQLKDNAAAANEKLGDPRKGETTGGDGNVVKLGEAGAKPH